MLTGAPGRFEYLEESFRHGPPPDRVGGRHDLQDDAWRNVPALEHRSRGGKVFEPAVGAGADEHRIDPPPGNLRNLDHVLGMSRPGNQGRKSFDIDLDGPLIAGIRVRSYRLECGARGLAMRDHCWRRRDEQDDAAHLGGHRGDGESPGQVDRVSRGSGQFGRIAQESAGAEMAN